MIIRNILKNNKKSKTIFKNVVKCFSNKSIEIDISSCYDYHLFDNIHDKTYTTKEELIEYYKTMLTMRRMEIICDENYKDKKIRGFCHLYDGQEATATGKQSYVSDVPNFLQDARRSNV